MARSLDDALGWIATGTHLFRSALDGLTEEGAGDPSALPGWTRKHVIAHVAANADAIGNLVRWAATGERTPMYSSPEQRAADIEAGSARPLEELVAWFDRSAGTLAGAMAALTPGQWQAEVVTAQGRTVAASETPWMRAREVLVHTVDLATGTTFADLPEGFLEALVKDVLGKRGADADVDGTLAARAAYLTGRADGATAGVRARDGGPAPALGPWL